jgi:hypothetical protein
MNRTEPNLDVAGVEDVSAAAGLDRDRGVDQAQVGLGIHLARNRYELLADFAKYLLGKNNG